MKSNKSIANSMKAFFIGLGVSFLAVVITLERALALAHLLTDLIIVGLLV